VIRWPNFFIIGAGKSGTTSLYHYVKQHPQVFMSPVKEPKYFALAGHPLDFTGPGDARIIPQTTTSVEAYLDLFKDAANKPVVGEASTIYLGGPEGTAQRVAEQVPSARIVAILRHPADRAYSAYMHLRRDGFETLESFQAALEAEPERVLNGYYFHWHLRSRGYYATYLQSWYECFPREQIRIYLYEDLTSSPSRLLADLFRFLGVDDSFMPDVSAHHNQSGLPHNARFQNFLTKQHPVKEWFKLFVPEHVGHRFISMIQPTVIGTPRIPHDVRTQLTQDFREEILHLQALIDRDLSHWLSIEDMDA
jgi:hypothetical protein